MHILRDFECPSGHITELFCHDKQKKTKCPVCGKKAHKIITQGKSNLQADEGAAWIKESADALLDRETAHLSDKPHVRALAQEANRTNLRNYMKAEGIRHAENEGGGPPVYRRPERRSTEETARILYERHRERKALNISTK